MPAKSLDFIIIGAQKAATTSLYKYLNAHPAIFMPPDKEVPFFTRPDLYQKGLAWYLQTHFANASPDQLWGKATPQYMCDPQAPARIYHALPEVKLIASLRHPIKRSFSHYKMAVHRGVEQRTFDEAISDLLSPVALAQARTLPPGLKNENKWRKEH